MRMIRSVQFFAEVFNGLFQSDFQRYTWLPVQEFFGAGNVWLPTLRIILYGGHCLDFAGFAADEVTDYNGEFLKHNNEKMDLVLGNWENVENPLNQELLYYLQ